MSVVRNYVRELIFESNTTQTKRLASFTNAITSDIMRLFHRKSPKFPVFILDREDLGSFGPTTNTEEIYELNVGAIPLSFNNQDAQSLADPSEDVETSVNVVVEIDRNANRFNVSGGDKDPTGAVDMGITIAIEVPGVLEPSRYGELRNQVANSVRHEIEHLTQGDMSDQQFLAYGRGNDYYNFLHSPSEVASDYAKYLLKPEEIPAYVRGEAHNAKSYKKLASNIEYFLNGYVDQELIDSKEKSIILDTWLDWAKKKINRKGF